MNKAIYRQTDSRWSKLPYPTRSYSFGGSGCGCCACTHVIIEQPRYAKYTPKDVRPYMVSKGFATKGHGTTWNGIKRTLEHYGNKVIDHGTMTDLFKTLDDRKAKGLPCLGVILFRAGTRGNVKWTSGGHYVAFVSYKKVNGKHYLYTKDSGTRHHDGWYCYETTMKGLIPKVWSALPPTAKAPVTPSTKKAYAGAYPKPTLKKGSKGAEVKKLQSFLNWYGNYRLKVDGKFGNMTLSAVKVFQENEKLVVDGIVGIKTVNKMHGIKK